ncbi:hypothetical protein SAMN05421869_10839 [Nonomuraea jiangxiensis]|uniref:HEAT repeat-containing protein n=1 Tax=Nonomuraea jiangxiensis TaxID=633440 RepID=A0A1G8PVN2_9ACTN|nr:hypothetical protein SAMN05421869_10839 [Nonomuraea jiangxiensis]
MLRVDWDELDHAYGAASDAPFHLLALVVGEDAGARGAAVGYLDAAMLHQGSVYSASGPFIRIVAGLLADHRTAGIVDNVLPWDAGPRPLRTALLDHIAVFAEACRFDVPDDVLRAEACPAGRGEADLQRISAAARAADWRLDPDPATRKPPPPELVEAYEDEEFGRAMAARDLLACRAVVPDIFQDVLPLTGDPEPSVRISALTAAVHLVAHPALREQRPTVIGRLERAAAAPEPRARAAVARLLGMLGAAPERLLRDEHPGVRACAALGQEGWLRCDLAQVLVARVDTIEAVLPAALGLAAMTDGRTYDRDLGLFVRLAFPEPLTEDTELTNAQRTFLAALIAHGHVRREQTRLIPTGEASDRQS